jgi:hypothetical protein
MMWIYALIVAAMGFALVRVRRQRKQRQARGTAYDATRNAA